jgi:hypothetical protein
MQSRIPHKELLNRILSRAPSRVFHNGHLFIRAISDSFIALWSLEQRTKQAAIFSRFLVFCDNAIAVSYPRYCTRAVMLEWLFRTYLGRDDIVVVAGTCTPYSYVFCLSCLVRRSLSGCCVMNCLHKLLILLNRPSSKPPYNHFNHCELHNIKMAATSFPLLIRRGLSASRTRFAVSGRPSASSFFRLYHRAAIATVTSSPNSRRPQIQPHHPRKTLNITSAGRRNIFIQTQTTPNSDVSATNRLIRSIC